MLLSEACKKFTNNPDCCKSILTNSDLIDSLKDIFASKEFLFIYEGLKNIVWIYVRDGSL